LYVALHISCFPDLDFRKIP